MKLYIVTSAFLLLMSGCSSSSPSITEYRITTKPTLSTLEVNGCADNSLKVAEAFSSSSLMSLDMNYGLGLNKQFSYSQAQYSSSVNHVITAEVLKLLREMQIFKTVQISKSRSRNDLILETTIDDFMQYFSEDEKSSYANVVISFSLIDTKTSKAVATQTFSSRVDTETLNAEGGVKALNTALEEVLQGSSIWFSEVCK